MVDLWLSLDADISTIHRYCLLSLTHQKMVLASIIVSILFAYFYFYLWMVFSLFIHETSHALLGNLVGYRVKLVKVGAGPLLFRFKPFKVLYKIHTLPTLGYAYSFSQPTKRIRLNGLIFSGAGVLANLFLFCLLFFVLWFIGDSGSTRLRLFICGFMLYEIVFIIFNLIPQTIETDIGPLPSDGKQIIGYLFGNDEVAARVAIVQVVEQVRIYDPEFNEKNLWIYKADSETVEKFCEAELALNNGEISKAILLYEDIIRSKWLSDVERAQFYDILASLPVFKGRQDLLPQALEWVKKGVALAPRAETLQGTYGSLLVEAGKLDEGIRVLRPLVEGKEPGVDRSISAAYLAKAYSRMSKEDSEVDSFLEISKEFTDPQVSDVAKRIEKEIKGDASPTQTTP